ncbi:DUF3833 domain-containing protein [Pseudomonas sp. TH05]|uniref:DUF3833 domain-containing protein n=1 Tax=unclassified Pseudomonas TaxID=196821 RepID=UPI00191160CD|nr:MULTISPECIES: DUF3833 domain-containing protein [unclassified Pseudomonas]MBK5540365.1 DUF3833 domain-containing protein [Pseudomonas sp. TH07]MBK5560410.1 DUF3833 domain-containing protein [Pseudomonas sp. TH05]
MWKTWILLLGLGAGLAGCGGIDVTHYREQTPPLELRQFFSGRVEAWGLFQKRSGEVIKRFHVVIDSHSEGDTFVMHEDFTYSDGTRQTRIWTLHPDGPGIWRGTAGDVVGEALGEVSGNTLRWRYVLNLPVDGKTYQVHFDDWMYLLDENTLANRSYMTKFGVELGQVTLFFRRQPGQS